MNFFRKKNDMTDEDRKNLRKNVKVEDHRIPLQELLNRLEVDPGAGLSSGSVKRKVKEHGENMLTPPAQTPVWIKFVKELTGFFSLLLWGGAILCFFGYAIDGSADHLFLGIVLVFVVVVTGVFSFYQNSKSESLMNSFKNMLPPKVKVLRDGCQDEILALSLVPGDIVFVEGGDLIPADMRVLSCSDNFQVDNAALTGESEPQKRKPECTNDDPLETRNLCFFGTQVPEGSCKGVIISTGDKTVMGRIAALAMSTPKEQTPINKEIHRFIVIISSIAMFLGMVFFFLNLAVGTPHIQNLVFMIGIIVANVPEGLLATVTVCLTLTAQRMHEKKVLVKNLEGVETLGSTSCICSDKTGTLTQNVMTVAQLVYGEAGSYVTHDAPSSFTGGNKTYDVDNLCFKKLCKCATLCNVATFTESSKWEYEEGSDSTKILDKNGDPISRPFSGFITQGDGSSIENIFWKPVGNASECAMIKFVQAEANIVGDVETVRKTHPIRFVIPFNSKNKYQLHIHETASGALLQMKGAPEKIINRCSHAMLGNDVIEMTEEVRKSVIEQQEALSANGLRCLGFAEKELDQSVYGPEYYYETENDDYFSSNFPIGDELNSNIDPNYRQQNPKSTGKLVFLGLMALIDPPRPAVPDAVERCKTAGVKVIMVTGDHPITAQAIAYKVGILWSKTRGDMEKDNETHGRKPGDPDYENPNDATAIVVPGHTISTETTKEEWDFILGHSQIVFARTSPQQKLVIVEENQRFGHIVAVTGDGVNDSPAIRKADIGIAMGIMGSEVSKNAADMILLDDNFASIVNGVEEGRLIFDNLKKSIAYTIQSNIPEITPFLAFILFFIPLPLTTFLILAIDLGTDMIPAISMAYELPEADIMMRPPRNPKVDRLVTSKMIHFSYGQIGIIQALAGFFTYMVVLNDYGYSPSTLPQRGNSEFWGKQPFFCKFNGGNYVNLAGEVNLELDPGINAPTVDYPFWFQGESGNLEFCGYALSNYESNEHYEVAEFDPYDSETYNGATNGKSLPTIESIQANEQMGYFEYIPWRGRTSAFWKDSFLYHDTTQTNSALNFGGSSATYFTGRPAGLWSLCAFNEGSLGEESSESSFHRGAMHPSFAEHSTPAHFSYGGCNTTEPIGSSKYHNALFCNGQSSEQNTECDKVTYANGDAENGEYNPMQAFYCKNHCGLRFPLGTDALYCDDNGNECGEKTEECNELCSGRCYQPRDLNDDMFGSPALNDDSNDYRQCVNIASSEVPFESLKHAQGAFFCSIVITQIAGLLVCKTRWLSLTSQGMKNNFMLCGIGSELILAAWLTYCSPINNGLGTRNLRLVHWFCAIPFAILIFCFDESRKSIMRATSPEKMDVSTGQITRQSGWLERNCAY